MRLINCWSGDSYVVNVLRLGMMKMHDRTTDKYFNRYFIIILNFGISIDI